MATARALCFKAHYKAHMETSGPSDWLSEALEEMSD